MEVFAANILYVCWTDSCRNYHCKQYLLLYTYILTANYAKICIVKESKVLYNSISINIRILYD